MASISPPPLDTLLLLAIICFICVRGVQITQLFVPPEVRNGTSESAILDCEYSLVPADLSATSGLVVKWFFNNGPAPVYQWIPGQRPQDLGILKGRLRLDYRASNHESTMHRALYILSPTTELSGEYKCSVSTFTDEDFMIGKMVVIAPEKQMYLAQSRTAVEERVNITCRAVGIFPEPKITLFREDVITRDIVELVARVVVSPQDYHYDIEATASLQEDLDTTNVFHCDLEIPHTSYHSRKSFTYYPGSVESLSSVSSRGTEWRPMSTDLTMAILLVWSLTAT